jgi:hypothetical protein
MLLILSMHLIKLIIFILLHLLLHMLMHLLHPANPASAATAAGAAQALAATENAAVFVAAAPPALACYKASMIPFAAVYCFCSHFLASCSSCGCFC